MAPTVATKKRLGVGAKATVLVSRLHPKDKVTQAYPNSTKDERSVEIVVLDQGSRPIRRESKLVVVFNHPPHGDLQEGFECWTIQRFVKVVSEGNEEDLFDVPVVATAQEQAQQPSNENTDRNNNTNNNDDDEQQDMPDELHRIVDATTTSGTTVQGDDLAIVSNLVDGNMINDDNAPAPENIPTPNENTDGIFGEWEHSGSCFRAMAGGRRLKARISYPPHIRPSLFNLFELFFFTPFVKNIIIPQTNNRLEANGFHRDLSYGEFLRWIGVWLLMSTLHGPDRAAFWSLTDINRFHGAPWRLGDLMSRKRFDAILRSIFYTDQEKPAYRDKFWEVRQMIVAWNDNMAEQFTPSWVSCLEESMSPWTNKYTCPGWMFVPRKPHPFGNEYHSVCCSMSGIMWGIEIVEGKDAPRAAAHPKPKHNNHGNTVGLLLRILQPIFTKGYVVVLDSGFCVLKGIVELKKRGVYASALIKKRRYWPKYIKGDDIKSHFDAKDVGNCDSWKGQMDEVDFHVYAMKEPDYVMSIMSTYGTNQRTGKETQRELVGGGRKKFSYPEVIGNHFLYRHSVDDHNNKRRSPISIEEIWATKWWPNRVFALLVAVTEVNVSLGMVEFCDHAQTSQIEFRKKLAEALIYNEHYNDIQDKTPEKRLRNNEHHLIATAHSPEEKNSTMDEWSTRRVTILSTSALPALVAPVAIASVPQGSTDVMNAMPFILLGSKTIFYHHAKFRRKMRPKNDPSIITHTSG